MKRIFAVVTVMTWCLSGCGSGVGSGGGGTSADEHANQTVGRPVSTSIPKGIYAGQVTCDYSSRNSAQGLVESYSYDFNETFSFGESGVPDPGVNYNPENDQLEFFGTMFDVTNRTEAASDTRYVQDASLVGNLDGARINGLITWTFTSTGPDSLLYQLDIAWHYRVDGVPWTENEQCNGTLTR